MKVTGVRRVKDITGEWFVLSNGSLHYNFGCELFHSVPEDLAPPTVSFEFRGGRLCEMPVAHLAVVEYGHGPIQGTA